MNVKEAMENALQLLESLGYKDGGDIHDDLKNALTEVAKSPVGKVKLPERD